MGSTIKVAVVNNPVPVDYADRLRPFFDAVCNKENWKYPVAATVQGDVLADTIEAIAFFTGGSSTVKSQQPGEFWVTSPGYYNVCGP